MTGAFKIECIFCTRELLTSCETFVYYISGIHDQNIFNMSDNEPPCVEDQRRRLCKSESLCTALDSPDYSGLFPFISSPKLYVS